MEIGEVKIEFYGHAGFGLTANGGMGKKVVIDPFNISNEAEKEKADIILITHSHYDHCSIKDIERLVKPGTVIIMTADCQSKITKVDNVNMQVMEVGDKIDVGGVRVEAVAAYNKDKDFHPKSEGWLGFVVKMKDVIVYHTGDSDHIPEMQRLSGHGKHGGGKFVALMPVSGTYVMEAEEAADAASVISPDLVIPMHYGAGVAGTIDDANRFVELCVAKGLKAEVLEKI